MNRSRAGSIRSLRRILAGVAGVFLGALALSAGLPLGFGTALRILLLITGTFLVLAGMLVGVLLPQAALYRNPPYHVPQRFERPRPAKRRKISVKRKSDG